MARHMHLCSQYQTIRANSVNRLCLRQLDFAGIDEMHSISHPQRIFSVDYGVWWSPLYFGSDLSILTVQTAL